jgi:hypothetical protein
MTARLQEQLEQVKHHLFERRMKEENLIGKGRNGDE